MKLNKKNIIETVASAIAALSVVTTFAGCDMLQSTLSSVQEEELLAATGVPSLDSATWYYNKSSSGDASGDEGTLKVNFSQCVAVSDDGVSGSMVITYTDAASGNEKTETISTLSGTLSSDEKSYYLDMSDVLAYIDGTTCSDNEVKVALTLRGFESDTATQKGRSVETFTKKISVKPLWAASTLKSVKVATSSFPAGSLIEIPANGVVSLADDAQVTVSGITATGLTLNGVSDDGKTIYLTNDTDISGQSFSGSVTISGIAAQNSGTEYSQSFNLKFVSAVQTSDVSGHTSECASLKSLSVTSDSSNLIVTVTVPEDFYTWNKGRLTVVLDNTNASSDIEALTKGIETYSACPMFGIDDVQNFADGTSIDSVVTLYINEGSLTPSIRYYDSTTSSYVCEEFDGVTDEDGNELTCTYSTSDWKDYLSSTTIVFTVPLTKISNAASGNSVEVAAAFSHNNSEENGIASWIPSGTIDTGTSYSEWSKNTITIDMSQALSITVAQ